MGWQLPVWLQDVGAVARTLLPGGLFVAWCLWAVNWRLAWPVLADGGWAPLTLIGLMAAFVWSRVWPSMAIVFGLIPVPNVLWQLGAIAILIGVALFCGWLQTRLGWFPPEIDLEPPAHAHDHHHAPAHAAAHDGHAAH
jgi:hypothetical protein